MLWRCPRPGSATNPVPPPPPGTRRFNFTAKWSGQYQGKPTPLKIPKCCDRSASGASPGQSSAFSRWPTGPGGCASWRGLLAAKRGGVGSMLHNSVAQRVQIPDSSRIGGSKTTDVGFRDLFPYHQGIWNLWVRWLPVDCQPLVLALPPPFLEPFLTGLFPFPFFPFPCPSNLCFSLRMKACGLFISSAFSTTDFRTSAARLPAS